MKMDALPEPAGLSSSRHRKNYVDEDPEAAMAHCCADCGVKGGVSLKTCKSCMLAKYFNCVSKESLASA